MMEAGGGLHANAQLAKHWNLLLKKEQKVRGAKEGGWEGSGSLWLRVGQRRGCRLADGLQVIAGRRSSEC